MLSKNIILVGFMGSGKTTIGKLLAEKLKMNFIDTDIEIEKQEGLLISEIFEKKGEEYFRQLESNFLQNCRYSNSVIATGGGMPCFANNIKRLKLLGSLYYLKAPVQLLLERIKADNEIRPIVKSNNNEELKKLISAREEWYQMADIHLNGNLEKELIVNEIVNSIK